MNENHYLRPKGRILIATIASFFILFLGQPFHPVTAFSSPNFYLAFAVSFAIALLLMYMVHKATVILDRRAPWKASPSRRAVLQVMTGVFPAIIVDAVLIKIYYSILGKDMIARGGHLDVIFVSLFIFGFNILYVAMYFWRQVTDKETELKAVQMRLEANDESETIAQFDIKYEGGIIRFDVRDEILFFYKEKRRTLAFTVNGRSYVVKDSLTNLAARFEYVNFYQINPSSVVNMGMLQGYGQGPRNETRRVVFLKEYEALIIFPFDEVYRITESRIDQFIFKFNETRTRN